MILVRLGISAVVLVIVYFGLAMTLSELSQVVVLSTSEGEKMHETRLWMVEGRSRRWLRAGSASSSWLKRIYSEPHVEVEIDGTERLTRAGTVVDFLEMPSRQTPPGPLGSCTAPVLRELGYTDRQIDELTQRGVTKAVGGAGIPV